MFLLSFLFSCGVDAVDTLLLNGKLVTVDERFSMVQAPALKDQRVVASGSNTGMRKLAGANTRVIDVQGRTVTPGLIDNHAHWIRAAEHDELRFDGVTARGFPCAELDNLAPDMPLALQPIDRHTCLNSAGLRAAKIDDSTPNPPRGTLETDGSGRLSGVVRGAGGVAFVAARVPKLEAEARMANLRKLASDLNSGGESGVAAKRQVCRSAGAGQGLPDRAAGCDQGSATADDDGRRQNRLRGEAPV